MVSLFVCKCICVSDSVVDVFLFLFFTSLSISLMNFVSRFHIGCGVLPLCIALARFLLIFYVFGPLFSKNLLNACDVQTVSMLLFL